MAKEQQSSERPSMRERLRVAPGPVTLLGYDPAGRPGAPGGRSRTTTELDRVGTQLAEQQELLYANGASGSRRRVLLVLQGMDTAGKDGVISHVIGQVGPAGVSIRAFKKPTPAEAAHHFLWRIRRALPASGMIGVFNRSHYEDVLSPKVHERIDQQVWDDRVAEIVDFERELAASGVTIVKCFLHIDYAEQRERLLARLDDPTKVWKFNPADIEERAYWSDYQATYGALIGRTDAEHAPWYIVPSDAKWYRNWAISRLLLETLTDLQLRYPLPEFDAEHCRARLQPPY